MSGRPRKAGLLGPQVEGYRAWLAERGYTPGTIKNMLPDVGRVGRWAPAAGLEAGQIDDAGMGAFRAARHAAGHRRIPGPRGMLPLLTYLREVGVIAAKQPSVTALDALLGRYQAWLVGDRGLAATTVLRYENTARRFLRQYSSVGEVFTPSALTGAQVNAFLLGNVSGCRRGRPREEWLSCARS